MWVGQRGTSRMCDKTLAGSYEEQVQDRWQGGCGGGQTGRPYAPPGFRAASEGPTHPCTW